MLSGILLPALLIALAVIAALITYRGIRRGGARFYTLERELILRRAALWLLVAVFGFLAAIGLLFYQRQQLLAALNPPAEEAQVEEGEVDAAATTTPFLDDFPPTPTATSSVPTATVEPTEVICRGVVEGTSGNGLMMRDGPNGAEITILPEGTLLTVLNDAPVEAGDLVWRKVRAIGGEEGWVAADFLTVRSPCGDEGTQ